MIARSEDSIDVDYDLFSLAGRAALIGGGVFAINKSVDDGVFKRGKAKELTKRNNKFTQNMKDAIVGDFKKTSSFEQENYDFKKSNFFNFKEDSNPNMQRRIGSPFQSIPVKNGNKNLQDLLDGGFRGQSSSLFDEIVSLHDTIRSVDEKFGLKNSGRMSLNFSDDGSLANISIKSNAGNLTIHPVNKEGYVTMGKNAQNKYVSKAFYTNNGYEIGSIYGADVGLTRYLSENYEKLVNGEISLDEVKNKFMESLQYDDKNFSLTEVNRINPQTVEGVRTSAMPDPYRNMGRNTQKTLMKHAAVKGMVMSGASDVVKGIINLEGSPIANLPFLKETSNPKQLIRSNVAYLNKNNQAGFLAKEDTLFMDEKDLNLLREELSTRGVNLGELAKEELLLNSNRAGTLVDNTRSLEISSKEVSAASEFFLNKMSSTVGLSPEEFSLKIKQGGFRAFEEEARQKLRKIGIDDYERHLKTELNKSFLKRKAFLAANKGNSNWATNVDEAVFFNQAKAIQAQGGLDTAIAELDDQIKTRVSEYRNRNIFGSQKDGRGPVKLDQVHKGLLFDDVHYSGGSLNMQLRREKRLGQGDKIHDPSGEIKAIIKGQVNDLEDVLTSIYKKKHGVSQVPSHILDRFKKVTFIANAGAMKNTADSRNAYSLFHSIREENKLRPNRAVTEILNDFDLNYAKMTDQERIGVFKKLGDLTGNDFSILSGAETGVGFQKSKIVGFGNAAIDMGDGGLGFFSERHIKLFTAMGAQDFAKEIIDRRLNQGAGRAYNDVLRTQELLRDSKYSGFIDFDKLNSDDFLENVFPRHLEKGQTALGMRNKYLQQYSRNGAALVNLGEEIGGYRNIAIFNSENLEGFIGGKIGSTGDFKKYTNLDTATEQIIRELKKPTRDRKKLEQLVKNYDTAMTAMTGSLRDNLFKGKVRRSLYGQAGSGGIGMEEYSEKLAKTFGTKNAQPFVASVSDKKYIEMFGPEKYAEFKRTKISSGWAMATREPVEGLSSIPVNVVPGSYFKDIEALDDTRIGVLTSPKNNIMKMLFGDQDGDSLSLIAAKGEKAANELKELAFGNSERSVLFRKHQQAKSEYTLKGNTPKSVMEASLEELRLSTFLAKDLEKGFVGIASNTLRPLHNMNAMLNAGSDNLDKFYRIENTLHTFAENIIKGKHQSKEDLLSGRGKKLLDAITANEDFAKSSLTDRIKYFRDFSDELFLGKAASFGDEIRKGKGGDQLIANVAFALNDGKEEGFAEAVKKAEDMVKGGWFTDITSDQAMKDLMEVSDLSKNSVDPLNEAIELSREEVDNALSSANKKKKILLEEMQHSSQEAKKMFSGVGGNIAKYALLPAAAFGFLGTVFGAKSSISSEAEFSDGQRAHGKTGHAMKPLGSDNMRSQKHMKPYITGTGAGGFQVDKYVANNGTSGVRYTDHTKNFDKYDMEDRMRKGY
jgi:hypothetical protein